MIDTCAVPDSPSTAHRLRRVAGRLHRALGPFENACRSAAQMLQFRVWSALAKSGICRKMVLVMNCGPGRENEGFYGQLTAILGLLDHLERNRGAIAGIRVDFGDRGLYYDPAFGENSWQYHFEPIDLGRGTDTIDREVDTFLEEEFSACGEQMARARAAELIGRYVHARPHIREKLEAFARAHFAGFHVIGIHYRGTDKWVEARRVPYAEICAAVREALGALDSDRCRLFVASDEQAFVDFMECAFPGKVKSWQTQRAPAGNHLDSVAIDFSMEDNYRKGADAVMDCMLLARCERLIRTVSSLGLCAGYFNPEMPVRLLNRYHVAVEAVSR